MPLLNKNNSPRSRRPSIESQVNDPVASTSTTLSELWASQGSDVPSSGDLPSPEQQGRHYSMKRSSVFKLRARSNTATSTSSFVSISSAMVRLDGSNRNSQDLRQLSGQSLVDLPGAKRPLFSRRKAGKRRSGQLSPNAQLEEEDLEESSKKTSVLRKGRKNVNQPGSSFRHLKHRISSPFDFQHLTHTDRDQLPSLEQTSEHDLVAEFCAVRASQAPRTDLNGIRADDLHFNNFSSETLANPEARSKSVLGLRSPPISPQWSRDSQPQPESPLRTPSQPTIRPSRSVESFSQPGIYPRAHRHTQSATPSPRLPSRPSFTPVEDLSEVTSPSTRRILTRTRSNRDSGVWDQFAPLVTPTLDTRLPTIADEADYFAHAVTTPDDSAIPMTPAYSPDLEDVAEEPERFSSPRPAPAPPSRPLQSPLSPLVETGPLYNAQRTPISRSNSRTSSFSSPRSVTSRAPMTRPMSQMSDTLGSAVPTRRHSMRRSPTVRRKSNTWRAIEESWEDGVDYIYENALEADCDFDWEHTSDDGREVEDSDRTPEQQSHSRSSTAISQHTHARYIPLEDEATFRAGFFPGGFRASLLVPCPNSVPELEARSAISASTADTGLQTPSDFFASLEHRQASYVEAEGFVITPSLLIPPEYKENSRDEMYNDVLADYEGSDRHFAIIDANQSVVSSSRSSHMRSSKRSSYDSSLMSSGQGSGSWSSPIRRSASSSGSLPELIHSRRSRKDFNIAVEQLSEQMASCGTCEEDNPRTEDDDTTPPGRVLRDKTFFAVDDEDQGSYNLRATVESEVRASLELARRGSTRSSHGTAHGHKYASSDGAAKLLASPLPPTPELQPPPKSRARAASTSNGLRGSRRPYLSLFPTPPKHSPLTTPTSPLSSKNYPILP